jgi:hypothetical protein
MIILQARYYASAVLDAIIASFKPIETPKVFRKIATMLVSINNSESLRPSLETEEA